MHLSRILIVALAATLTACFGGKNVRQPGGGTTTSDAEPVKAVRTVSAAQSTVFVDLAPTTNAEYDGCVKEYQCDKNAFYKGPNKSLGAPELPALGLDYESAMKFCAWAGKRLGTEAEITASLVDKTADYPEWTNDWAVEKPTDCEIKDGAHSRNVCEPVDRMGICSGIFPCDKKFRLKKVYSPNEKTSKNTPYKTREKIAFRCVSDTTFLTKAPAWNIAEPLGTLPDPQPLAEKEQNVLHNLEAVDTLDKPLCKERFTSPEHCKDPDSYMTPNESQNYTFGPYIKNLGGGYVGVAADANYSYIALARSRYVWLMDFDVKINALHRTLRAFIIESDSIKTFIDRFAKKNRKASLEILKKYYGDRADHDFIAQIFRNNADGLMKHYQKSSVPDKKQGEFGWLRFAEHYRYIRLLYQQNRIAIVPGDLLKDKSLQSIGKSAKALGIPVRVYYPSNAEEFWFYSDQYKSNVLGLPFDEASVAVRTVHEYPWHTTNRGAMYKGFWHYVVHGALNYQRKLGLNHTRYMDHFKMFRIISKDRPDFSTIDFPNRIPEGVVEKGW